MKTVISECPLEEALLLLNGRWRVLILYWLGQGPMRFNELKRANAGISHRMLALDLRHLEGMGVISRTTYPTVPPQVEYALTDAGRKLLPLLTAIGDWWQETRKEPVPAAHSAAA